MAIVGIHVRFQGCIQSHFLFFKNPPSKLQKLHRSHPIPGTCKKFEEKAPKNSLQFKIADLSAIHFRKQSHRSHLWFPGGPWLCFQGQTCNGNPDKWTCLAANKGPKSGSIVGSCNRHKASWSRCMRCFSLSKNTPPRWMNLIPGCIYIYINVYL